MLKVYNKIVFGILILFFLIIIGCGTNSTIKKIAEINLDFAVIHKDINVLRSELDRELITKEQFLADANKKISEMKVVQSKLNSINVPDEIKINKYFEYSQKFIDSTIKAQEAYVAYIKTDDWNKMDEYSKYVLAGSDYLLAREDYFNTLVQ